MASIFEREIVMRTNFTRAFIVLLVLLVFMAPQINAEDKMTLQTQKDKLSYGIGVNVIRNLRQQGVEVNIDALLQGIKDSYTADKIALSEDELRKVMKSHIGEKQAKKTLIARESILDNKKRGETFLAKNTKKESIVTLASGLQYKVLKEGSGNLPKETDVVFCRYRGTLIDGTEFDSTDPKGQPAKLRVGSIITGFKEALLLMPVGSKWQLFIPYQLAYGHRSSGREIEPYSALIFEVELISIDSTHKNSGEK